MINSTNNDYYQLFPPQNQQHQQATNNNNSMNYLQDGVLDSNHASSSSMLGADAYLSSPVLKCVSPQVLMSSQNPQLDSAYLTLPMPIPQQQSQQPSSAQPPDLYDDLEDDELMMDDFPLSTDPAPRFPFKSSSPYYRSPTIHTDPAFFNNLFPLTVSPQDAVLKHDDEYPMDVFPGSKESSKFYQDFFTQPVQEFEEPEAMDEDDDDEDNEYDEVLISSSDDEFDEDLYAPFTAKVPGLTSFGVQPLVNISSPPREPEPIRDHTPENLHIPTLSVEPPHTPFQHSHALHAHDFTPSPSYSDSIRSDDADSLKPRKRVPVSHTGPHKCDIVNQNTGKTCNKIFSRPYDLIRHQDTIHAPVRKTFKCEACGDASKTFSRMDALSRHIRVKHSTKA